MVCPLLRLLLLHSATATGAAHAGAATAPPRREVRWYMPTGGEAFAEASAAWLASPPRRAAMTGIYACCNFFTMNASGAVRCAPATTAYSS